MNITFGIEAIINKGVEQKYGIFIRCTQHRKHKRIHTGITISAEHWNPQKKAVRKSHPLYLEYNQRIQNQLQETIRTYHTLLNNHKTVSVETLINTLQGDSTTLFFPFAYQTKMKEIESRVRRQVH